MRVQTLVVPAVLLASLVTACGGSTEPKYGKPAAVAVSAGDRQSGAVATALAAPIAAKVTDDQGRAVPGATVNFVIASGGGSLATTHAVTNADGVALDEWTLGTVAGAQSAAAEITELSTGAVYASTVFIATAAPGPPAQVRAPWGNDQTGYAGSVLPDSLVVFVYDRYLNPLQGITVTFTPSGGGTVSPVSATTAADGHAKTSFTLGTGGTPQRVVASVAGTAGATFTAISLQPRQGTVVPLGDRPFGVAVSSGGVAYVTRLDAARVTRFDPPDTLPIVDVGVWNAPTDVRFNASGTKAYVANQLSQDVSVLNAATNAMIATIPVTGNPFRVVVSPDETRLYVTTNLDSVYAIDLGTNAVVGSFGVYPYPAANSLAISADGSRLYVGTRAGGTVVELDAKTMTALRTFTPGGVVQEVVLSPDGSELYAVDEQGGIFTSYALATGTPNAQVNLGGGGFGMAITPDGTKIYITIPSTGVVAVLDRASKVLLQTYDVGGTPRRVAFAADGTAIIANEAGWVTFLT